MASLPWRREEQVVLPECTVLFPSGLPGFPSLRCFRLVTDSAYSPPFELLASEEEPSIGFFLIDPKLIDSQYAPPLDEADRRELQIQPGDQVCLRAIVTVGQDPGSSTVNLAAPLLLNLTAGVGRQAVLEGITYALRAPLVDPQASQDDPGDGT